MSAKKNRLKNKYTAFWVQQEIDRNFEEKFYERFPDTYTASYEPDTVKHKQNKIFSLDDMYTYPYHVYEPYKVLQNKYFSSVDFANQIRFWGVKKLPAQSSALLPRNKDINMFAAGKRQQTVPFIRLFSWYNLYKEHVYDNAFLMNTNVTQSYEVSTNASTTRMTLHSVLKNKIPITTVNGYEAIIFDFKSVHKDFFVDFFGEGNVEQLNVNDYWGKHIDFFVKQDGSAIVKKVSNDREWTRRWESRYEEVFSIIENHEYEINIYQFDKLVFRMPTGKKPLRIDINYFDYRSHQGFCQFLLWYFFGETEWQDGKQYFELKEK